MTAALAILFMALQLADWWTTKRFLAAGVTEANKAMAFVIERAGMKGLLAVKILVGAIIPAIFWTVPLAIAAACVVYVGIVIWNYRQGSTDAN